MPKSTDIRVRETALYFLPYAHRVPLKFGAQTVSKITAARARVVVVDRQGRSAEGWGETPLSIAWVWPSTLDWDERERRMREFCCLLARELPKVDTVGHPMEVGNELQRHCLDALLDKANADHAEPMPHLAALVCLSLFDIAIHDAFGRLMERPVFETLGEDLLSSDLGVLLDGDEKNRGLRPPHYLRPPITKVPVWHLVGGLDPLETSDLKGDEPQDGYPLVLREWIRSDGLKCLKIKLRGNDQAWDFDRIVHVGQIAIEEGCDWLTTDFNCTVMDPGYVCEILDRLVLEQPRIYGMMMYVEQPFPYDLEAHRIEVQSVSARKPLFLDESAHDWRFVRLGRELGWTGVALKTCKTFTGALLSLCWARSRGMTLMVQDLTNTMLAQVSHVALAAHAGTIMGVESNGMQFAPAASELEAKIHPGLYRRRNGFLDRSTVGPTGFGYREKEIGRVLPEPAAEFAS